MAGQVIYQEAVTAAPWSSGSGTPAGVNRWEGQKRYKTVLLASSQSADVNFAANGDAVGYSDYSAHTVVADATDADEGGAGIICNFANWDGDFSANYGKIMWIQTGGPATTSQSVGGSVAARDRIELNTSSTDLTFDKCTTLKESSGHMIDTTTEVYLDCPY